MIKKISILSTFVILLSYTTSGQALKQGFKIAKFIDYIDSYYVDSVNADELVENAIVNILEELDPHSTYIPSEELKKMREPLVGNFEGIGISFNILKDTLYVVSPISGGPSERVGIRAGDKIVKVEGENIAGIGISNEDVFKLLRGKKGTIVAVSVLRKNVEEFLDFTITRDKIPIFSVDASYMINENTGYIKINRFAATTIEEFKKAADILKKNGAENLILDLTNNGGGFLDASVKLADEFLPAKKLVVYTEGRRSPRSEYYTTSNGGFQKGRLIILIDEGSASASEIVTGAIQDWDRGIVIGRRSFGKGLVQREMMLPDESAVRITIAKYYTPSGRLIQKPFDEGNEKYYKEIYNRYSSGELQTVDSIHFSDSLKYKTLVKKRTVYGGGGIMPDLFVPYDTSFYTKYYSEIVRKGVLNSFVLEYVDKNRIKLDKDFSVFSLFETKFVVSDKMMNDLVAFAAKDGIVKNEEQFNISEKQMKKMIKALVARDLYGSSEFYQIYNTSNNTFLKSLEVLNNWEKFESEVFE